MAVRARIPVKMQLSLLHISPTHEPTPLAIGRLPRPFPDQ
jgi:hypothetical protein